MLSVFFAATASSQTFTIKYMVKFIDKKNSPYSLNQPEQYLSQRAIDRRIAQNIPIEFTDLPVNPNYIDSLEQMGLKVTHQSKWLNAVLVETEDSSVVFNILAQAYVKSADLLYYYQTAKGSGKQGTMSDGVECTSGIEHLMSSMKSTVNYGASYTQNNMIAVNYLHYLGYKGDSMMIAVLDAGYLKADQLPLFDSLLNSNRLIGTWDVINKKDSVYHSNDHGMKVLSVMAANIPGQMVGSAPNAEYLLIRTEDHASEFPVEEFYWVVGAEYADSAGADLINSSLGYSDYDLNILDHTYADMDGNSNISTIGADLAARKGVLVVNSAGNEGDDPWQYITSPSDGDSVLCVGATYSNGDYAPFSSVGPSSDGDIKPNVAGQGAATTIASYGGGTVNGNGTSFSSPLICGATACLWQANREMNNMEVIEAIEKSASQYNFPDSLLGYGIPNYALAHLILNGDEIPDIQTDKSFTVMPNPFNDQFYLSFNSTDTQDVYVQIYNMNGKLMYEKSFKKYAGYNCLYINDLGDLKPGIYLVRLKDRGNNVVQKVIKQ